LWSQPASAAPADRDGAAESIAPRPSAAVSESSPQALETRDEQASRMLARMGVAVRTLDFEGTLVYLLDNRLETLHLVHRVQGGQVQERLVSLSGPPRALTRSRDRVTCTMANGHPISIKSQGGQRLLRARPIDPGALAGRYRVEVSGSARVVGRETDVVTIRPLDALRYGYRFHLDRETGLPLKSDLIDLAGDPIEQLLFTSLALDDRVSAVASPAQVAAPPDDPKDAPPAGTPPGRFDRQPAGFEQTMHDAMLDPSGARVEHFLFSDRLSSYSVYIESDAEDGLVGLTRVGAAHAVGRRVGRYQVTAMGEVPAATVEAAVAGVRWGPEAAP